MAQDSDALAKLYDRAQLGLNSVQKELETIRAGLGVGGIRPGVGSLAAGNTACDSGCDGGCSPLSTLENAIRPEELKQKLTARVTAVLEAHKVFGTDPLSKAAAGNEACDSGCNGGCGGSFTDIATNPAVGARK